MSRQAHAKSRSIWDPKIVRDAAFKMESEGLLSCIFLPTPRGLVVAQKRSGRI